MLSFKEFLNEEERMEIPYSPDKNLLEENLDLINNDLEAVTAKPFVNSAVFFNAIRGTLERFGILIPPGYETPIMNIEAEVVYSLDNDSGYYVYIVHNLSPDGLIEGYAQVVNEEDLNDLLNLDDEDITEKDEETRAAAATPVPSPYLLRARRSDDDSDSE
jgi:hypothetical protein